jgi:hypothetical protein
MFASSQTPYFSRGEAQLLNFSVPALIQRKKMQRGVKLTQTIQNNILKWPQGGSARAVEIERPDIIRDPARNNIIDETCGQPENLKHN